MSLSLFARTRTLKSSAVPFSTGTKDGVRVPVALGTQLKLLEADSSWWFRIVMR